MPYKFLEKPQTAYSKNACFELELSFLMYADKNSFI